MSPPRLAPRPPTPGLVSVVVPCWNGRGLSEACYETLAAQECDAELEFVFVDNGSEDDTAAWLASLGAREPRLHALRLDANHGFAEGCNAGIRAASGAYLLLLNNDTLAPRSLCARLHAAWLSCDRAGLVAPSSNYVKGRQCVALCAGEGEGDVGAIAERLHADHPGMAEEVEQLSGLCLFAHRSFFERVGLFDPVYGIGNFEDDDLCLRARLAGRRLLVARDAYVHHLGNKTFDALGVDYRAQYDAQRALHDARWGSEPLYEVEGALEARDWTRILDAALPARGPARAWILRCRARAFEATQRPADAIRCWEDFLAEHPLHTQGSLHHVFCLLEDGREAEGRRAFVDVLEHCALDRVCAASALTRFARHCWARGSRAEAIAQLDSALEIVPGFVPGANTRAVWHLELDEWDEARACLEPLRDRGDADVLANLGIALFRLGRCDEAIEAFAEGAAIGGPRSSAALNLERLRGAVAAASA